MTTVDLEFDQLNSTVDALRRSISNRMMYGVGKDAVTAHPHDWLHAAALAVRDRLVARWMKTTRLQYEQDVKRVYYLSMEFLIGRTFTNALLALGIHDQMKEALASLGVDMDALIDIEPDAALGNGGLGRLAACFLDSMATLGIPGFAAPPGRNTRAGVDVHPTVRRAAPGAGSPGGRCRSTLERSASVACPG